MKIDRRCPERVTAAHKWIAHFKDTVYRVGETIDILAVLHARQQYP